VHGGTAGKFLGFQALHIRVPDQRLVSDRDVVELFHNLINLHPPAAKLSANEDGSVILHSVLHFGADLSSKVHLPKRKLVQIQCYRNPYQGLSSRLSPGLAISAIRRAQARPVTTMSNSEVPIGCQGTVDLKQKQLTSSKQS
jgi:hypothetical protein